MVKLVDVGEPFKVSDEHKEKKMKENQRKIWKNRVGLIWEHLLGPASKILFVIAIIIGIVWLWFSFIIFATIKVSNLTGWDWDSEQVGVMTGLVGIGMPFIGLVLWVNIIKDQVKKIKNHWNDGASRW